MSGPASGCYPVHRVVDATVLRAVIRGIFALAPSVLLVGCADQADFLKTFEAGWTRDAQKRLIVSCERTVKTDEMLEYLANVPNVQSVVLNDTNVTDDGLRHLSKVPGVELLSIGIGRGVTDAGIEHLAAMKDLKDLALVGTRVTDSGIEKLDKIGGIERLCLSSVSDTGLSHLDKLPKLRRLELINADITHVGVEYLKGMHRLKSLSLVRCNISDTNVRDLKRGLPGCRIVIPSGRSS